jgi:hypothetical protein
MTLTMRHHPGQTLAGWAAASLGSVVTSRKYYWQDDQQVGGMLGGVKGFIAGHSQCTRWGSGRSRRWPPGRWS